MFSTLGTCGRKGPLFALGLLTVSADIALFFFIVIHLLYRNGNVYCRVYIPMATVSVNLKNKSCFPVSRRVGSVSKSTECFMLHCDTVIWAFML